MKHAFIRGAAAAVALLVAATPIAASAQMKAGLGQSSKVTVSATVKSVNMATRHATLVGPGGDTFIVSVSSAVHNLDKIKPGDKIKATYVRETEFVISAPNTPLPANTQTVVAARAKKGEIPAGAVAHHIVVSGSVVAVDPAKDTIKLVDPKGGQVHVIKVTDAQRKAELSKIKVGDSITAYVTEAVLISVS